MGDIIKQMLKSTYELEGLLLLAESRGENTSDMILSIIKEKTDEVGGFANELCALSNGDDEQMPVTPDKEIQFTDLSDEDNNVVVNDEDVVAHESIDEDQDERLVDYENELQNVNTQREESVEQPANETPFQFYNGSDEEENEPEMEMELVFKPEDELTEESFEELKETESENEEEREEPEVEMELVFKPEDEYKKDFEEENETATNEDEPFVTEEPKEENPFVTDEEEQSVNEEEREEETVEVKDPAPEKEVVTLDEAYIRDKSKLLRNAFSINDKFRFQRELFGNNATEMTDAINLADAMNSYSEAEEYFYEDLGWDKESEEVIEFMKIIKNHFL